MLTAGKFKGRVVWHGWVTSQAGTPGLAVRVGIMDDFAGAEEEITGTIWLSPKAMGMARMQLKALGFDCDTQELSEIGVSVSFIDRECDVVLKEEQYKGKVSIKMDRFGAGAPPPTKDALVKAQAGLRAAKKARPPYPDPNAMPPDAGADVPLEPPKRPPPAEVPPPVEGDIPF